MKLLLTLANPYHCLDTSKCGFVFDRSGGLIGRSDKSSWILQGRDELSDFPERACKVLFYQNAYCLEVIEGHLYVNNSAQPIAKGSVVELKDADHLLLEEYEIDVMYCTDEEATNWLSTISEIMTGKESLLLLEDYIEEQETPKSKDLLVFKRSDLELDPMKAFQDHIQPTQTSLLHELDIQTQRTEISPIADTLYGSKPPSDNPTDENQNEITDPMYWLKDE